ncbi:hypothetical protein JCM3765_001074 [Sporobolomyces pararoseus]
MVNGVLKSGKLNPQAPEFTLPGQKTPSSTNGAPPHHHPHGFKVDDQPQAHPVERSPSADTDKSAETATPPHHPQRDSGPPSPRRDPSSPLLQARFRQRNNEDDDDDASSISSLSSVYSLLPLRTLRRFHLIQFAFTFILLFLLPVLLLLIYKREFRFWPFALGIVSWLAGETLREVVVDLFTTEKVESIERDDGEVEFVRRKSTVLPAVVHSVAQEVLRLGAIYLVVALLPPSSSPISNSDSNLMMRRSPRDPLPPLDTLFWSAIFLSLGWAFVEIVWGSRGFWKQLECYEDVLGEDLEPERYLDEEQRVQVLEGTALLDRSTSTNGGGGEYGTYENESGFAGTAEREEREMEDFEAKMREVQREEIEEQLGVPLYEIPIFVTFVWRLDSILLSLVFTLLLSLPFRTTSPSLVAFPLLPTFIFVALVHAILSALWVLKVKTVGIPSVSYASLVTLVGLTFASLAAWGVLR